VPIGPVTPGQPVDVEADASPSLLDTCQVPGPGMNPRSADWQGIVLVMLNNDKALNNAKVGNEGPQSMEGPLTLTAGGLTVSGGALTVGGGNNASISGNLSVLGNTTLGDDSTTDVTRLVSRFRELPEVLVSGTDTIGVGDGRYFRWTPSAGDILTLDHTGALSGERMYIAVHGPVGGVGNFASVRRVGAPGAILGELHAYQNAGGADTGGDDPETTYFWSCYFDGSNWRLHSATPYTKTPLGGGNYYQGGVKLGAGA
jgi:hypothetical protein